MQLSDYKNNRLVIFEKRADAEFWDKHWETRDLIEKVKSGKANIFIKKITGKFLPKGSRILEGGCGIGQNVYGLNSFGYDSYGVDFAESTIEYTQKTFPDLQVSKQDVTQLDFSNDFFDGYWSIGVIEHLWEGYENIILEAFRVIKPNGYFFLTFPYMSPLRKLKIKRGAYKTIDLHPDADDFYQFILDADKVESDVTTHGFKLVLRQPFDATKCLKDEIPALKPYLQKIYDSQSMLAKATRFMNTKLFSRLASHNILLVFRKS